MKKKDVKEAQENTPKPKVKQPPANPIDTARLRVEKFLINQLSALERLDLKIAEIYAGQPFLYCWAADSPENVRRFNTYMNAIEAVMRLRYKVVNMWLDLYGLGPAAIKASQQAVALALKSERSRQRKPSKAAEAAPVAQSAATKVELTAQDIAGGFDSPETAERFLKMQKELREEEARIEELRKQQERQSA
jgi:hypothetical protein